MESAIIVGLGVAGVIAVGVVVYLIILGKGMGR